MQTCSRHVMWMCCVVLRMRGEAGGARGKAGVRTSGSNYPPISAAYWLPPSNPTPYHVPGSMLPPIHYSYTCIDSIVVSGVVAADRGVCFMLRWIILDMKCFYEWRCNRTTVFCSTSAFFFFFHSKRKACLTLTDMPPTEKQYVFSDARYYNSVEISDISCFFYFSFNFLYFRLVPRKLELTFNDWFLLVFKTVLLFLIFIRVI